MYLLDTNVLSAARKVEEPVRAWLEAERTAPMYLSVVTIGEIERGIEAIGRRDGAKARVLGQWLQRLLIEYSDRILPVDLQTGRAWGRITAGPTAPLADALIAATAKVHDLVVVTRNVRDYERFMPIGIVNPWDRDTWVRA